MMYAHSRMCRSETFVDWPDMLEHYFMDLKNCQSFTKDFEGPYKKYNKPKLTSVIRLADA